MKDCNEIANEVFARREKYHAAKKRRVTGAVVSLSCVCLAVILGVGMWLNRPPVVDDEIAVPEISDDTPTPETVDTAVDIPRPDDTDRVDADDIITFPKKEVIKTEETNEACKLAPTWEERTISEQFTEVSFNSCRYSTRVTEISADNIGDKLADATMTGYDYQNKEEHTVNSEVFGISGVSSECAVAVRFETNDGYYVYVNSEYRPETLGELIDDLNLTELISFGTVHHNIKTDDGEYLNIEFDDLADEDVWRLLLSETSVKNEYDRNSMYIDMMSVSVDIPLLGYKNIGMWVTEDGYLVTNILNTAKAFYIGVDKTDAFVTFVLENCIGYQIVYVTAEEPETAQEVEVVN